MIVPNWQAMGRAIPGDAYIKNFGTEVQPIYEFSSVATPEEALGSDHLSQGTIRGSGDRDRNLAIKSEGAAQGGPL